MFIFVWQNVLFVSQHPLGFVIFRRRYSTPVAEPWRYNVNLVHAQRTINMNSNSSCRSLLHCSNVCRQFPHSPLAVFSLDANLPFAIFLPNTHTHNKQLQKLQRNAKNRISHFWTSRYALIATRTHHLSNSTWVTNFGVTQHTHNPDPATIRQVPYRKCNW